MTAFEIAVGALLSTWALIELWYRVACSTRDRTRRHLSAVESVLVLVVGLVLMVPGGAGPSVLLAAFVGIRGLFTIVRSPRGADDRHERLLAGVALIALGALLVVAPQTVLLGVRAALGAAGIGIGLVLIAVALGRRVVGLSAEEMTTASIARVGTEFLRSQHLGVRRRQDLADTLFFEPPGRNAKLTSFWVMMLLSVGIASFAVIQSSTAVVGITLQSGLWGDGLGAFLLFSTNFVAIVLSGTVVFFLTGFAVVPFTTDRRSPVRRVFQSVLLGGLLILIPLSLTSQSIWTDATRLGDVQAVVEDWIPTDADLSIQSLDVDGSTVQLTLVGSTSPPDTSALVDDLNDAIGEPVTLEARYLPTVALTPGAAPPRQSPGDS